MSVLRFDPNTIDRPHLLTIRYSNFCESARWAMDHAGEAYTEVAYAVGTHMEPVGMIRSAPDRRTAGSYPGAETGQGEDRRQRSVPLLCLPGGRVLCESWEILGRYVGAVEPSWQRRLDAELGPAARRVAYAQFLDPDRPEMADALIAGSTDEERAFWEQAGPFVMDQVRKLMAIDDEVVARDRLLLSGVFAEVSEAVPALPSGAGDSTSAAWWIAFSSLIGVALCLPEYGGEAWEGPSLDEFDPSHQAWVHSLRETPAGRATAEFYQRFR